MGFLDKIDKEKLAEFTKKANEVSKVVGKKAVEASKVAGVKAAEASKVAGVKAVEVSKVAGVKAVEVSKVAGVKAAEVSKVAGVKAVEVSKVAGVKAVEVSKVAGVKAVEVSKVAGVKAVKVTKETSEKALESAEKTKESKLPMEGAIIRYAVKYVAGFRGMKPRFQEIGLNIFDDRFYLKPTTGSASWFKDLEIPYDKISKFEITMRTMTLPEEILAIKDIKLSQADNNIEIDFRNKIGKKVILRLQMSTGTTPIGQAAKCKELLDLLNSEEIYERFVTDTDTPVVREIIQQDDVISQIRKLNELKDIGALTEDEYQMKKTELLTKI